MYDANEISKYIVKYSEKKDYGISNLKLQKVLYYVQIYFLVKTETPCFMNKIEAWNFGPVIPDVYRKYKQFGSADIPAIGGEIAEFDESIIADSDKEMIDAVVDEFKDFSATDLTWLSQHQVPWMDAYVDGKEKEITVEMLKGYFCE